MKSLIGQKVKHKTWGEGTIIAQDDLHVTVAFATKTAKFVLYPNNGNPSAFENYILLLDAELQAALLAEIQAIYDQAEKERLAAEEARRKAEADRQKEYENTPVSSQRPTSISRRDEGKRMPFYVFQSTTFKREAEGGYIWAPITNRAGTALHHWTRLLDVRKGDIILHGTNGYLKAISVAQGECYDCKQPKELVVEGLWDIDGRRVDCDYIMINNPIKTSDYRADIVRLSCARYSPFDKDGYGNMGYLFEINRELAKIFVSESVKCNAGLATLPIIKEILAW